MRYRYRTNDYVENGKVWDIYDVKTNKKDIMALKKKTKNQFAYRRIIKRNNEYLLLVRN